ncbi:hemerythrin domain-containing protein [Streptomyces sp. 5K101]|uniref:hemerythrin domain-containing protein n=1 Tax=Streptomyces sp. 5K101 TaxID=3390037 RepID=UPI0039758C5E
MFDEVEKTTGDERRAAFRRLVRMLAVHETAEEEVIHPFTRRAGPGGEKVVEERLREEREARELLSCLDGMDTDGPKFPPELQVRLDVMRHAWAEERHRVPVAALPCGGTGFAVLQPAGTSPGTLG